jgi:hypothetical protein
VPDSDPNARLRKSRHCCDAAFLQARMFGHEVCIYLGIWRSILLPGPGRRCTDRVFVPQKLALFCDGTLDYWRSIGWMRAIGTGQNDKFDKARNSGVDRGRRNSRRVQSLAKV